MVSTKEDETNVVARDWTGNGNSIYRMLGASNHTDKEREVNDYYATDPKAAELLLEKESFSPLIWECACGEGHLAEVFKACGYEVFSSDIIDRGYGDNRHLDFLETEGIFQGDIITNPPYKFATEFCEHALNIVGNGHKVAMFLKLQFLESNKRRKLFDKYPPKTIWVSSNRLLCAKNAEFEAIKAGGGSAVAYAWFVWEKGYTGDTIVKWFN